MKKSRPRKPKDLVFRVGRAYLRDSAELPVGLIMSYATLKEAKRMRDWLDRAVIYLESRKP